MSKTEKRHRKGRRSGHGSSRRDSLSSQQNDGADVNPADLVGRLEDQVRREFITRQRQVELNAKLQDEYDQLRKRLAEAETYIDQLRLGASVKFDKKFVFTYDRDALGTNTQRSLSEGTHTGSKKLSRLGTDTDNETSALSSNSRARRAEDESRLMARLFEVRDLEEQIMALKKQLEERHDTDRNDNKLTELYSAVKALQEHQQELNEALAVVNTSEESLDHKQAQDQSLMADELSRVTNELQQLQHLIAQHMSHAPDQHEALSEENMQETSVASETLQLSSVVATSDATTANRVLGSEVVTDALLHSHIPEEYLAQTGKAMSGQSYDQDDSKYCTSVSSSLSSLSLNQQSAQQKSVLSCNSPTLSVSETTNEDGGHNVTPTEDCAGGSEWSETSSQSSVLPYSDQTPLVEQKKLVPSASENDTNHDVGLEPQLPSGIHSTPSKSQQPSRIPIFAKRLHQKPTSTDGMTNDDYSAIPHYQSSRKPMNFDDLTLNNAHSQQPVLSRIPVLDPTLSPTSSYYRPPSPYGGSGMARRAGVGGRHPSPPAASSRFSHFVANESDVPSPGKAGRETLPRDKKDLGSDSESTRQHHHPSVVDDEGIKALQEEVKGLRKLLEQQQQKPIAFDPSTFQFPFWQPSPFPFSSPVHSAPTAHGESIPPRSSALPTHNSGEHVPPIHEQSNNESGGSHDHNKGSRDFNKGSHGHNEEQTMTVSTDTSGSDSHATNGSHGNHHTNSSSNEPAAVKPHPLTSKVAIGNAMQQQHAQFPEHISTNDTRNNHFFKPKTKRHSRGAPSHNQRNHRRKQVPYSNHSPEASQSDLSDSSISILPDSSVHSNDASSPLPDSTRLLPSDHLDGFQRDDSVAMETLRVPSHANLSAWVCPLCGGRSVIVDSSGTRLHSHRQPEQANMRSVSTQHNSHHGTQSTRRSHHKKDFRPTTRSRDLHYNTDMPSNRSGGLHHGYTSPVQGSSLHYSSDTPGPRSRGLHYGNKLSGLRSGMPYYDSDPPVLRSTGTPYSRSRPYRKLKRRSPHIFTGGDAVTFTHPKATSTPVAVQSSRAYDHTSDSSTSVVNRPADYIVLESTPRHHRRHHVRSHTSRHYHHGDRHLATSSNEDEPTHYLVSRSRPTQYSPTLERSCVNQISLDEACRLARQLKRRSEKMYSNLSVELSVH